MLFLPFLILPCLWVSLVMAQTIQIGWPREGDVLPRNQTLNITVERPDTLQWSWEIGIAIVIDHCTQYPCENATYGLGTVLYNGGFDPEFQDVVDGGAIPLQNISVLVPPRVKTGNATLSVVHCALWGAGPYAAMETVNVLVVVT